MRYPVESFAAEERQALEPHFTNLDRPVFALVNLPETVKGALFARYSRYPGTLRRLFLDEFAGDLEGGVGRAFDGAEGERARRLYENVVLGRGVAVARRHVRGRPGLRAAAAATDGIAAARGARAGGDDPAGAPARRPELRRARRAAGPRGRVDLLFTGAERRVGALGRPARA